MYELFLGCSIQTVGEILIGRSMSMVQTRSMACCSAQVSFLAVNGGQFITLLSADERYLGNTRMIHIMNQRGKNDCKMSQGIRNYAGREFMGIMTASGAAFVIMIAEVARSNV